MNISLINYISDFIYKSKYFVNKFNFTFPNQKYKLETIISEIFYVLRTGISRRNYRGPVNWHTLYFHFCSFSKYNIFENCYKILLNTYFLSNKTSKLKYQFIDSTFIKNQFGINKIARNKFYKNKNVIKISLITDVNGIPISILTDQGNIHDSKFVPKHFEHFLIQTNSNKYINHNRYKQYFIADKAYDTNNVRTIVQQHNYVPIIPFIKRSKIYSKNKKLNNNQFNIYKKRIKIEHLFSWIKKNRRLESRFEKYIIYYNNFLFLALIKIIFKYIKF